MAVMLRLMRKGSTHRPFFHLVAIDSRKKRKFLQLLGYSGQGELSVDQEAVAAWRAKGAKETPRFASERKKAAIAAAKAAAEAPAKAAAVPATADAAS